MGLDAEHKGERSTQSRLPARVATASCARASGFGGGRCLVGGTPKLQGRCLLGLVANLNGLFRCRKRGRAITLPPHTHTHCAIQSLASCWAADHFLAHVAPHLPAVNTNSEPK